LAVQALSPFISVAEPSKQFTEEILATRINDVVEAVDWSSSQNLITMNFGLIFGKYNLSVFDYLSQQYSSSSQYPEVIRVKRLAELNDYDSDIIDSNLRDALTNQPMLSHTPFTINESISGETNTEWFSLYDRYMLDAYRYAEELNWETQKWNMTQVFNDFLKVYEATGGTFLLYNPLTNSSWYLDKHYNKWLDEYTGYRRWYDERAESLNILVKLSQLGVNEALNKADEIWKDINSQMWNGEYYNYVENHTVAECAVAFHTIVGEYYKTRDGILFLNNSLKDIDTKLLKDNWSSLLWSPDAFAVRHATTNQERRLMDTLNALTVLHSYYPLFDETMRGNFRSMLSNGTAWKGLLANSGLYSDVTKKFQWYYGYEESPEAIFGGKVDLGNDTNSPSAAGAMLMFLEGIIPDSGNLAIPLLDERCEDTESMFPSTHFGFNYQERMIRIPVIAGRLEFQFGSETVPCDFGSDGIYEVRFSSDWDSIVSVSEVGALKGNLSYISGSTNTSALTTLYLITMLVVLVVFVILVLRKNEKARKA
jgi:hypothetical protein